MTDDEARVAKRQISKRKAYRELFDSPVGRIVLLDLMAKADFLSIAPATEFEVGRRSIVAEILAEYRMNYDQLLKLVEERVAEPTE